MNPALMNDILNGCPCNEPKRFQCIIRNIESDDYDHYLLLTIDQIRMVKYLLTEDIMNDIYTLIVLDEEGRTFEKV